MLKKVLIANRGEIALRIVRACNELGIKTLAVYSEADEQSLHVQLADEAICIGPAAGNLSYLKADRIIAAAEIADVDGIHPGYGFLAENADFAEQCGECGIKFIGPGAEAIINFGDKAKARDMAIKAKVPVIPGSDGTVDNEEEAITTAKKIGYPVIIKAVAGGGGKGMRTAHNAVSFVKEYNNARNEAEKAFGNGAVYLERFLDAPRHIEIQLLGDQFGNVIHLGERDCSIQRRHQKVIEEAPSPFISDDIRKKMGRDAVKLAKSVNYEGAGTVEFLVDGNGDYFFIEMNTRIQVEHGVTEEVTGVDLVKEQLLIASGQKLSYEQKDIQITKHCIECRVCAEDPSRNFAPCPGEIGLYYAPGGHGVRIDSHCYSGYTIPPYYDSMIAKVMTIAKTRELALDRMDRALGEYLIHGIKTNIPFSRAIIRDPIFREGKATTKYIEEFIERVPKDLYT
ncbi:MAG: acetyl-CoA carboxylase biotin carboxylase subunit [Opitutae bacterium]|jgi:acetyl-CoA carboxylase biotin carboxylase subunit|nr:acetyl-CoA carboxylase biotin carboxylase subunit [Opitutae bacterium]MDG1301005.1 acetyl-CoA carboxylase biotin carboxylase subunit [Opitutae bacterium]